MNGEARQGLQFFARPQHASGHEAPLARQGPVRICLCAQTPQQRLGFETRATTHTARVVAAVLGQEHTDVHLVGLAFQVLKKALHAIPLFVPGIGFTGPVRVAVDHPVFLRFGQLRPRRVARDARIACVAHQVVLVLRPGRGLQGFDGTGAQGFFRVGDDEAVVHANHTAKTTAGCTSAHGRVEREQCGLRVAVA